jgi:glutathione S-transferase
MIRLYQLHWSHFVEKVRWALDYKGVEWSPIDVEPFGKRQMRHLSAKTTLDSGRQLHTVPTIHDETTGAVVGDSSEILKYLERTYPTPALFPEDATERAEVTRWMLWLDSTLGLAARRLAYTQLALEHPGFLAELFVPSMAGEARNVKARITGAVIAGVLTRRFGFLHNRRDRVYEELERCLLIAAARLNTRRFLVGDRFTAADLTLAALMRPTGAVPFIRDHPRLQELFEWRATQLREHRREPTNSYEAALHETRRRRGWTLGAVPWMSAPKRSDERIDTEIPTLTVARNDQQSIGRWPRTTGAYWYLQLRRTSGLQRTHYP